MNTVRDSEPSKPWQRDLIDVLVRFSLLALMAFYCFRVIHPFLSLLLWAIILAVVLYPLHQRIRRGRGWSDGRTATLLVLLSIAVLAVPLVLVGESLLSSALGAAKHLEQGQFHVPAPKASVAEWPVVGPKLHAAWTQLAADPHLLAEKLGPRFRDAGLKVLGAAAGAAGAALLLLAALAVAGIFMAWGQETIASTRRVATWLVGPQRAGELVALCAATIRAVAQGVVGIAFIQALLVGVAFVLLPVPGAGLLTVVILMLGIMQIPATVVTIPVIVWVLAAQGVDTGTIVFSIYVFIAGLADNVLKPLLLGRGVEVPMPVILIGAIGGMVTDGLIGLFIGPVVLGVFYQLFWRWVDQHQVPPATGPAPPTGATDGSPAAGAPS
jgi:predicted PurR-regulated permease PerM